MAIGNWSRWGRGDCEGYTLEFGPFVRIDVVRTYNALEPFRLSYPKRAEKFFATALEAIEHAEKQLASDMPRLIEDWTKYKPGYGQRRFKQRVGSPRHTPRIT